MSFESNVRLTIALANPDLDAEEQEQEALNLLRDIKDLDIESAELVEVTELPEGAKSVGGFLVGVLQTEVSLANFKKVLGFLRVDAERLVARHRLGNKSIELEVEANGKKLKVKASSQQELVMVIEQAQKFIEGN